MALNDITFDEGGSQNFIVERAAVAASPYENYLTEPGPSGNEMIIVYVNQLDRIKVYSSRQETKQRTT